MAAAQECEAAAQAMPDVLKEPGVGHQLVDVVASGTSYTLTGAGYVLEAVVMVSAGIVGGVMFCSPIVIAEAAAGGIANASIDCIGHIGSDFVKAADTDLGEATFNFTSPLRESYDLTPMSMAMRSISLCYEARDRDGDAKKALVQLNMIKAGPIYSFSTERERAEVDSRIALLENRDRKEPELPVDSDDKSPNLKSDWHPDRSFSAAQESKNLQQDMIETARQATPHYWLDMRTGRTWRFVLQKVTGEDAERVCAGVRDKVGRWRLPTPDEFKLAKANGMVDPTSNRDFAELPKRLRFWQKNSANDFQIYDHSDEVLVVGIDDTRSLPHLFCVK